MDTYDFTVALELEDHANELMDYLPHETFSLAHQTPSSRGVGRGPSLRVDARLGVPDAGVQAS
jgi:hypothetical protein